MQSSLVKIESTPDLVDRVYSALLDAISGGVLQPGIRITQEEIAEKLNVSRQPVLQALRLLKKDGFVEDAPGRGLLIAKLDANLVEHVYQVRGALDALAAKQAALRVSAGHPFSIPTALIKQGLKAARQQDINMLIGLDIEFHTLIYKASANSFIEQSAALHWQHIKRAMGGVLQSNVIRDSVWHEHQAIAQAISQGNATLASRLMQSHGELASKNLISKLNHQTETSNEPKQRTTRTV